jgi:hypothetical protein
MLQEWLGTAAWPAFLAEVVARPPVHRVVKLQVTGPLTLATTGNEPATVARRLAAAADERIRALRELGLDALLIIDEPGLATAGRDTTVWDPLRAAGAAAWGLHVCGPVPWSLVAAAAPDVVSFDLSRYGIDAPARRVLGDLVRRGGRVAWGALDPAAADAPATVAARMEAALGSLGLPRELVARRSLLTPSCGSGLLSPGQEQRIAACLEAAAGALRRGQPSSASTSPRAQSGSTGRPLKSAR